jgi:hypothetical protein
MPTVKCQKSSFSLRSKIQAVYPFPLHLPPQCPEGKGDHAETNQKQKTASKETKEDPVLRGKVMAPRNTKAADATPLPAKTQ